MNWISCKERLPEVDENGNSDYMLCTLKVKSDTKGDFVLLPSVDFYSDKDKNWYMNGEEVIAWMPIPDPYKEGAEDLGQFMNAPVGRWIVDDTEFIECNQCHCRIRIEDVHNGQPYYCPNCGDCKIDESFLS